MCNNEPAEVTTYGSCSIKHALILKGINSPHILACESHIMLGKFPFFGMDLGVKRAVNVLQEGRIQNGTDSVTKTKRKKNQCVECNGKSLGVIPKPGSQLCLISQKISANVLNTRRIKPFRLLAETLEMHVFFFFWESFLSKDRKYLKTEFHLMAVVLKEEIKQVFCVHGSDTEDSEETGIRTRFKRTNYVRFIWHIGLLPSPS